MKAHKIISMYLNRKISDEELYTMVLEYIKETYPNCTPAEAVEKTIKDFEEAAGGVCPDLISKLEVLHYDLISDASR